MSNPEYPSSATKTVRTVCDPNCHANPLCGIDAIVAGEKIVAIKPAEFPVEGVKSRACLMGMSRLEQQYHPDRLLHPMRRVGERGDGNWKRICWEEAIDLFAENRNAVAEKYGCRSVLFSQGTGSAGLLTRGAPYRYAALTGGTIMDYALGGIDYGVPKGLEYTFGFPAASFWGTNGHSYEDAVNSKVIVLWGGNPVVTRSVDHVPLKEARRRGTKLICIDPIRSETASICDQWISPRPGTDGALALGLLNQIMETGEIDWRFLEQHSNAAFLVRLDKGALLRARDVNPLGSDEFLAWCSDRRAAVSISETRSPVLEVRSSIVVATGESVEVASVFVLMKELAAKYTLEEASRITEVPVNTIRDLACDYMHAKPAAIRLGYGLDHWYYGDLSSRAIAALAVVTGNIGKHGAGISMNAGGRSVPLRGLAFYSPDGKLPTAMSMMDIESAVVRGKPYAIKMECISLGNPFNQGKPNRPKLITKYVDNLEFIVVIDHFMTDTAKYADLVLPACTIFERTDVVGGEFVQLQQPAVKPEGEAKSDFDIFRLLADRTGYGEYFAKPPGEYINEVLKGDDPLLSGLSYDRLEREKVISPWKERPPHICFTDLKFPTTSGRAELYCERLLCYGAELPYYREPIEASPKNPAYRDFPLVLLTPHSRYRIHSIFANLQATRKHEPEPVVRMSPKDAIKREIADRDIVEILNERGRVKIRCQLDDKVRPGCVLVGEGYWVDQFIEGDVYSLIHDLTSPTALNYVHNDVLVQVRRVDSSHSQATMMTP